MDCRLPLMLIRYGIWLDYTLPSFIRVLADGITRDGIYKLVKTDPCPLWLFWFRDTWNIGKDTLHINTSLEKEKKDSIILSTPTFHVHMHRLTLWSKTPTCTIWLLNNPMPLSKLLFLCKVLMVNKNIIFTDSLFYTTTTFWTYSTQVSGCTTALS